MFKKILLYLGTEVNVELIRHSLEFAEKTGAKLTVLNVFENPRNSVLDYFSSQGRDLKQVILDGHNAQLDKELDKDLRERTEFTIRWGKDFIECIRAVNENKYDLVICPPSEAHEASGSTAMHLMRKCPCPVWVHHGHLWRGAVRILAAIGHFDGTESGDQLNKNILEHAAELNRVLGGKLHVLHCWSGYLENVTGSPFFSEKEVDSYLEYEEHASTEDFNRIVDSVSFETDPKRVVIHGSPSTIIPEYAEKQMIDIVVMGSVARTGVAGLLIGNTAEVVACSLTESLLAIKPAGFVTPVK